MQRADLDAVVLSEAAAWLARMRWDERTTADEVGPSLAWRSGRTIGELSTSSTRPGRAPAVCGMSCLSRRLPTRLSGAGLPSPLS